MEHTTPQILYEKQLKAVGYPACSISNLRGSLPYKAAITAIATALRKKETQKAESETSNKQQ